MGKNLSLSSVLVLSINWIQTRPKWVGTRVGYHIDLSSICPFLLGGMAYGIFFVQCRLIWKMERNEKALGKKFITTIYVSLVH